LENYGWPLRLIREYIWHIAPSATLCGILDPNVAKRSRGWP
jgi:hypothetical protein